MIKEVIKTIYYNGGRGGEIMKCQCDFCGKEFERFYKKVPPKQFHNYICFNEWNIKNNEGNKFDRLYKQKTNEGYIRIYMPDFTFTNKDGWILEHTYVVSKKIGRKLYPYEVVHHKKGIKDDNRLKELELTPKGEHNTQVQKVYQENIKLKEKIKELELLLVCKV